MATVYYFRRSVLEALIFAVTTVVIYGSNRGAVPTNDVWEGAKASRVVDAVAEAAG